VTNTGGLADSVNDSDDASILRKSATGFVMKEPTESELISKVGKALAYYQDKKTWKAIQENGMRQDLDWSKSAIAYMGMYKEILNKVNN
jgi:starch synthase